jgi:hypothetical protein
MVVEVQQWPIALLAAPSPFLLRAGGGGPGLHLQAISPSQTLETGLPVCTLLAILILCWYSPLETILWSHMHRLSTVLPMLLLCPPCVAAALAFVLHSLKHRNALASAALMVVALVIRQQILATHHMRGKLDWAALSSVLNVLGLGISYFLYRRSVTVVPQPTKETLLSSTPVDDAPPA